jgi:hypothetical protein
MKSSAQRATDFASKSLPPGFGSSTRQSPGALQGSRAVSRGVHEVGDPHLLLGQLDTHCVRTRTRRTNGIRRHRGQSIFGLSSCCDRAEFMFALVMTLAPISIVGGTRSPLAAASAVLTPS